jgi:hypothetical protein
VKSGLRTDLEKCLELLILVLSIRLKAWIIDFDQVTSQFYFFYKLKRWCFGKK